MSADEPSRETAASDFAAGTAYPRTGSSTHRAGWVEAAGIVRDQVAPPAGSQHVARTAPEGSIPRAALAERIGQRVAEYSGAKTSSELDAKPSGDSAIAANYARAGSSAHQSGWQPAVTTAQESAAPPFGSQHQARAAAEGAIPRTPLAERLRQRVAEHEKG